MSEALEEVVKWLKQIPVPVSAEVEVRLREEYVDIQAMRGLCDAQLLQLGFDKWDDERSPNILLQQVQPQRETAI
jgi:hypothetical protein